MTARLDSGEWVTRLATERTANEAEVRRLRMAAADALDRLETCPCPGCCAQQAAQRLREALR